MKRLCYASLLKVIYYCRSSIDVYQKTLNGEMLLAIDPNYDLTDDDNAASTMAAGGRNIPPELISKAREVKVIDVIEHFRKKVIPKINKAEVKIVILAIIDVLAKDNSIPGDTKIYLSGAKTKDEIINETVFDPAEIIANLFLYSVLNVKNSGLRKEVKTISESYVKSFRREINTISVRKNEAMSTASIKKTIQNKDFNNTFIEVDHPETLGLKNNNELRVFQLNILNNKFSNRELQKFLLGNIGRYVYSRAEIEKFKVDGDVELIAYNAFQKLNKHGDANQLKDNGLGDMMLYAFLEQVLEAPKIMSKIELNTTASHLGSKSDGIHLLAIDNGLGSPYHQLVFGASKIIGDLHNAIDIAMSKVQEIKNDPSAELSVIESTLFGRVFDDRTAEYMKSIVLPNRNMASSVDHAFGVFLGYTLDIDSSGLTNHEFRAEVVRRMAEDVKKATPCIVDKINNLKMDGYSFYFYILPFNDASIDKEAILGPLIMGGEI